MESSWKLQQISTGLDKIIDYRGKTPPKSASGIPLVSAKHVKNGRLDFSKPEFISFTDFYEWKTRGATQPGDVFITTEAPVGEVACQPPEGTFQISRRVMALRANESTLHGSFLLYALQEKSIKQKLLGKNRGTTVSRVLKTDITALEIPSPPLAEQRRIAAILGALDDKIELNRKMNKTLEEMAQALFKSWFVDFDGCDDFVESELGPIPRGWKVSALSDLCKIGRGASPRPIMDFVGGTVPWIKIADATKSNGPFVLETKEFIKREGVRKSVCVKPGDLILSNSATCGLPVFVQFNGCIHDGWLYFNDLRVISKWFLYQQLLILRSKLNQIASGSVQKNLNIKLVSTQRFAIPTSQFLERYSSFASPVYKKILSNTQSNQILSQLRDTLLPKLISGEIRVPEAEDIVESAL